jgi:Fic family protein
MIKYEVPQDWIRYDPLAVVNELVEAKGALISLNAIPYQKSWADKLQQMQLKREAAGTSRIEGAEFTDDELEAALRDAPTAEELFTRSQRQARAAKLTYQWIAQLPHDYPVDKELVFDIHRRIVTGADECPTGRVRKDGENVQFGAPRHRGAEGGDECLKAFSGLLHAVQRQFKDHDVLIQALALHYHFAAIHPFLDGNGRTARALEAFVLQKSGLRDPLFIAMSNYYYDEKTGYLKALSDTRAAADLTAFLKFGLKGIELQCRRLLAEIRHHVSKALFRDVMYDLFNRMKNTRKRVIAERQLQMLKILLEHDELPLNQFYGRVLPLYSSLSVPNQALGRDLTMLLNLGAVRATQKDDSSWMFNIDLDWATRITDTAFFKEMMKLPKAKTYPFL